GGRTDRAAGVRQRDRALRADRAEGLAGRGLHGYDPRRRGIPRVRTCHYWECVMSIATLSEPRSAPQRAEVVPVYPVTQRRVFNSEWIKFSTLRSSWITLVLAMLGTIGVGALASWGANG